MGGLPIIVSRAGEFKLRKASGGQFANPDCDQIPREPQKQTPSFGTSCVAKDQRLCNLALRSAATASATQDVVEGDRATTEEDQG